MILEATLNSGILIIYLLSKSSDSSLSVVKEDVGLFNI